MKYVQIYTYKGEKVITTPALAEIVEKERRSITCKAKANGILFEPHEMVLLEGLSLEAFKQENGIYGNALGSRCRVFCKSGVEKVLRLFCKGHLLIDWDLGEVAPGIERTVLERHHMTINNDDELQTAMSALHQELQAIHDVQEPFIKRGHVYMARSLVRSIAAFIDDISQE